MRRSAGPDGVDDLESSDSVVNVAGQEERPPESAQSVCAADSGSQRGQAADRDFVSRRPLTRSRTRMSSVSLVPETGKTSHVVSYNHHCRGEQLLILRFCKTTETTKTKATFRREQPS